LEFVGVETAVYCVVTREDITTLHVAVYGELVLVATDAHPEIGEPPALNTTFAGVEDVAVKVTFDP
jgi:hypothetical protein